eukprot:gene16617-biopygen25553
MALRRNAKRYFLLYMHIEKDNDKQAFTSPYRKPPIEKLAQDKVCAELLLLGFIEPAPSAQHAANPVVALKKGPDGQYTATRVCYNYKAINLLTKDMHTGAQHGNADAMSRFSNPTAEDNTGARIDLDSDLYAAFPTVPTTPYVPLDLTLGHIVDYILDVRSVLSICTTPLPAAVTYMAQNGITLYEMCGGMCAGLEAALRNGIQVNSPALLLTTSPSYPSNSGSGAPSPPLAPGRQLDTDLRLAAMSKDTDGLDIHSDQFVLEYLRRGVLGSNWTTSRTRRVLARSRKYRLGASPTGEERIIRILANGIERIVPAPSQRGNTMLMHAVEYFSAALVVVPIPAKEAIHTVYAHSHGVLAHFGAYALCISDNGPEFQGKFKEHLLHNFIDHRTIHPNHPQGNGFVERSVGTIKAALTKICSENLATDTWDIAIAKVVTAYNCSPKETTKCAPFTLLYARAPVMNNPEAQLAMYDSAAARPDRQHTGASSDRHSPGARSMDQESDLPAGRLDIPKLSAAAMHGGSCLVRDTGLNGKSTVKARPVAVCSALDKWRKGRNVSFSCKMLGRAEMPGMAISGVPMRASKMVLSGQ